MGEASRSRTSTVESTHSSSSATTATSTTASTSASSVGPVPILAGKSIAEIFSNFSDVLNLSHVMLLALDEAVPDRPSKPLPLSPRSSLARLPSLSPPTSNSGSPEPELCSSGGTEDSDGVHTPLEGDLSSSQEEEARRRALSSTSRKERRAHAPPLIVGKSLLPILPFLKQYSLFISNFAASLSRLSALEAGGGEEGARWQAFCEDRRRSGAGRNLGLGGMLLGIVQRVPRYRLMLGDLVKFTERDHPDTKELMRAWETVDKGELGPR